MSDKGRIPTIPHFLHVERKDDNSGLKEEAANASESIDDFLDQKVNHIIKVKDQTQHTSPGVKSKSDLTCLDCGRTFASKQCLWVHITGIHHKGSEFCKHCGKTVSLSNLRRHIKEKHQKLKKPCPECGKEYGMSNLSKHIREAHKKENKKCPECGQFFGTRNISKHIKTFHSDKKKVCDICNEEVT